MDPPLKWDHRIVELPYSRTPSLCTEVISCSLGGKYQKSRIKPYFLTKAKKWTYYILVGSYKHKHGSYLAISSLNIVSNKFYKKPVPPFKFFLDQISQKKSSGSFEIWEKIFSFMASQMSVLSWQHLLEWWQDLLQWVQHVPQHRKMF